MKLIILIIFTILILVALVKKEQKESKSRHEWNERLLKNGKCYIEGFGIYSKNGKHIKFNERNE